MDIGKLATKAANASANFRSLRDEYGITTADLIKFGASVNEMREVIPCVASFSALVKLIEARYGEV